MGSDSVMVDSIPFPSEIVKARPLSLLGHGITDMEIHFLQIKFTAIGIYLDPEISKHLEEWKGKTGIYLAKDCSFFDALVSAPVEKLFRIVVIKEVKGSQYGVQLENAVRDRLVEVDKFEEDEESTLEKISEFFRSFYFKSGSVISFHFSTLSPNSVEISVRTEEKGEVKVEVENENVVEMMKRWYLGGDRGVSPTTVSSLAATLAAILSG